MRQHYREGHLHLLRLRSSAWREITLRERAGLAALLQRNYTLTCAEAAGVLKPRDFRVLNYSWPRLKYTHVQF